MRGLPAIAMHSPEMKAASLLARKATALDTSSGSPSLETPLKKHLKYLENINKSF